MHSDATQQWIVDSILPMRNRDVGPEYPEEPWWVRACGQLQRGILLKVEDGASNGIKGKPDVTELLLYGTLSLAALGRTGLSAPSSPPNGSAIASVPDTDATTIWKIYALPLSSQLLRRAAAIDSPLTAKSNEARFLALLAEDNIDDQMPTYKRKKITSLFEDATQQRKRLRRRGGEGISKAMATFDAHPASSQYVGKAQAANTLNEASETRPASRISLSRASSTVSTSSLEPSRPPSRRETFTNSKRSSLHRVESISFPLEASCVSECSSSIEQQNKTALARIVMAGMRVYGLQQRKRSNKPLGSDDLPLGDLETQLSSTIPEDDREYKILYHQAIKAACFTFRLHITTTLITQEALREVVDRLLAIFCTDPLNVGGFGSTTSSITETTCETGNPFDLPSTTIYNVDLHKI